MSDEMLIAHMNHGKSLVTKLCDRNPGALNVLIELFKSGADGVECLQILDELKLHGSMIWVGYKDYCGQDLAKFKEAVKARDPLMLVKIKEECGE